jgi:hypothetical protein
MDTLATQFGSPMDVTLTPGMLAVGILVSLFTEFVKAIISRWTWMTETITKPGFPLLGCACCMGIFALAGLEQWMLGGIAVGLMTGGGYDAFKGMAAAKGVKIPPVVPLLLIATLLAVPGCIGPFANNPKAELLASQKTFIATVDSLTTLQNAGKFTPDETQQLTVLIHQGRDYLDQWWVAIKAGQPKPDVVLAFQAVLDKLVQINFQKGGGS